MKEKESGGIELIDSSPCTPIDLKGFFELVLCILVIVYPSLALAQVGQVGEGRATTGTKMDMAFSCAPVLLATASQTSVVCTANNVNPHSNRLLQEGDVFRLEVPVDSLILSLGLYDPSAVFCFGFSDCPFDATQVDVGTIELEYVGPGERFPGGSGISVPFDLETGDSEGLLNANLQVPDDPSRFNEPFIEFSAFSISAEVVDLQELEARVDALEVNSCIDSDSDGYGDFCALGPDCDDDDPNVHPGATEICDGIDNDCDSEVDDGNVCSGQCIDFDADGFGDNCSQGPDCDDDDPSINPGASDSPDGDFVDSNCDGIDGDIARAVFVSPSGVDTPGAGTMDSPVRTIGFGMSEALANAKDQVYVSEGDYVEPVRLLDGISLWGGFSQTNAWQRAGSFESHITNSTVAGGLIVGIEAFDIISPTTVGDLHITTEDTSEFEVSNYAIYCSSCPGVTFERNVVTAGNGGPGRDGSPGAPGEWGDAGGAGGTGSCDDVVSAFGGSGGTSACAPDGGEGGWGGQEDERGGPGQRGGGTGGAGGPGGAFGDPGSPGQHGDQGSSGGTGSNGAGGTGDGWVISGYWTGNDGADGFDGQDGSGGGGGGGGGGQTGLLVDDGTGNGGGGGGSGGCAGTAGRGGSAGGGSFGVFLHQSTGVQLIENSISTGSGGRGGAGGDGADGENGGQGGPGATHCTDEVGAGGNGGAGGRGGRGGHGGGGAGGPSCPIYRVDSTTVMSGNVLQPGAAGSGGSSGGIRGQAGSCALGN